jgi:hypothetical protein
MALQNGDGQLCAPFTAFASAHCSGKAGIACLYHSTSFIRRFHVDISRQQPQGLQWTKWIAW